jgi:cytochrome c6
MRYFSTFRHFLFAIFLLCVLSSCQADKSNHSGNQVHASNVNGEAIFNKNCKICHGADGRLGLNGAKDLSKSVLPFNERVNIITNGRNLMTPFGKFLSATEIDSVAAFTFQLRQLMPK